MPPKRKALEISRATSSPPAELRAKGEQNPSVADTPVRGDVAPLDTATPWTDDQEIALFKSIIRFKPAGMHKHFRMLSISQQLQNQAYEENEIPEAHTRIPGIWQKLGELYNLEAIDSREDSFLDEGRDDGSTDSDPHKEPFHEFILPEEDYGESMFDRRLDPEGTASPSLLDKGRSPARKRGGRRAEGSTSGRASTIEDTEEEAKSSPIPPRGRRGGRGRGIKPGPRSRLLQESSTRSAHRESESASAVDDSVGSEEEEAEDEEQDDEDEDREEDDSTAADSPAAAGVRRRGGRGGSTRSRGRGGRAVRRGGRRK